jgi:hypothetical protein
MTETALIRGGKGREALPLLQQLEQAKPDDPYVFSDLVRPCAWALPTYVSLMW